MASRQPGYYLSNGLYVSGRPDAQKDKTASISSAPAPFTGSSLKNSGDFEKMFPHSGTNTSSGTRQKSGPQSGTGTGTSTAKPKSNSGPVSRRSSGPQSGGNTPILPATGLITSGPIKSASSSGPLLTESTATTARQTSLTLTSGLTGQSCRRELKWGVPRVAAWLLAVLFVLGFGGGGFVIYAFKNWLVLEVVAGLFALVLAVWIWNWSWGPRAVVLGFLGRHADAELRSANDGQFVKVTGIVTCGTVPLETSFLRIPRCVYSSTALYEYRGRGSMTSANSHHRLFSWGLRSLDRHMVDFYISDFQSGLRALVKAGNGTKVYPFVDECTVSEVNASINKDLSPDFVRWLAQRNLSSDDRNMRLKEGFIKEGSTVSVMGVVQRTDNVLMIVPPTEPVSTGCDWCRCLFPASLDGIVVRCEDASETDVIPV